MGFSSRRQSNTVSTCSRGASGAPRESSATPYSARMAAEDRVMTCLPCRHTAHVPAKTHPQDLRRPMSLLVATLWIPLLHVCSSVLLFSAKI